MRSSVVLLAFAAAMAGCASHAAAQPTADPHPTAAAVPVSVRVVLPSRTMTVGSQMSGHVVVDNTTGHAIHTAGCYVLFTVALASSTYHPDVTSALCLQLLTIPAGKTSYPVTVLARYLGCSMGHPGSGFKACLPGSQKMPPLPPGDYYAKLFFQVRPFASAPPAVPVRLTPK
jgi:hypothetical protein